MKILITSGGTQVPIDDVRHIGNMSSGRFGSEIALACLKNGHSVDYLYSKTGQAPHLVTVDLQHSDPIEGIKTVCERLKLVDPANSGYHCYRYTTFDEYHKQLQTLTECLQPDITILVAAVSDFGCEPVKGKISSDAGTYPVLLLHKLPKLISLIKTWSPKTYLVGFKLLSNATSDERTVAAKKQIEDSGSDLVVVNDILDLRSGNHRLYVYGNTTRWDEEQLFRTMVYGEDLAEQLLGVITSLKDQK